MPINLKITVITAVYNRADCIAQAVQSVQAQTWPDVEHVVIDGTHRRYVAIAAGLPERADGVVERARSDDFYADNDVLHSVAAAFADPSVDAVYGDLDYVAKADTSRIIRRWRSGEYNPAKLAHGWMPPHPTLFLRRRVIEQWGGFDTSFRIAADYDAVLRYFGQGKIRPAYIPRVLVKMRLGGESNRSLARIWLKTREDYAALTRNGVGNWGTALEKSEQVGAVFVSGFPLQTG